MNTSSGNLDKAASPFARKIRSFVRREGRMSARQKQAIEKYFSQFGIAYEENLLDFDSVFSRTSKRILEIGFGMGDTLAQMAQKNPDQDFVGIEVHRPGVGSLLATMAEQNIKNIRIINHDAVEVLAKMIPDHCLDNINIFFPDPWPKKRHHKRRLIHDNFVSLLSRKLVAGGKLHIATDWENYAQWIEEAMQQRLDFSDVSSTTESQRPKTKYEKRGIKLGHKVWDKIYIKQPS